MGQSRIFLIVALILLCVAFVFHLIGWSVPFWVYSKTEISSITTEIHYGLWQLCTKVTTSSTTLDECKNVNDVYKKDWLKATKAMEIIAFLLFLPAVIVMILKMLVMKDNEMLPKIVMVLGYIAGLFALIGVIIFGAETELTGNYKYHFGFAFTIIGAIFGISAGIVLTVDMVKG